MPEGPELKISVDFIRKKLVNQNIRLEIIAGRYTRHPLMNLNKVTFPIKVKSINLKGKFIYFEFYDTELTLWVTFGMSGHFVENNDESSPYTNSKHNNIVFHYGHKKLYFQDYRNFGTFKFVLTRKELDKKLNKLGLDLMDINTKFEDFYNIIVGKRANSKIAEALLEQRYFCGIGNYCRSEALYLSKINPCKKVKDLSVDELKNLFHNIRVVLFYHYNVQYGMDNEIILKRDLKYLPFNEGGNGKRYVFYFVVYQQEVDPLGNKVSRTKDKNNRMIHWIPSIQK